MKKYLMPAMIIMIIAQILVPSYMIWNKYDILKTGNEYRFKVNPVDPYDAFRGRYVSLNARLENTSAHNKGRYGTVTINNDGFAVISKISAKKPKYGEYVTSKDDSYFTLPIDRYYMDEHLAPKAEIATRQPREPGKEAYVTVRIKNGDLVVSGLYIDGVAIEKIVNSQ